MKTKELKRNKGITLIALVITIIVLLILAGVTIATLTGENGILTKAMEAREASNYAGAKEAVETEVAGSFDENGRYDPDLAKEYLEKNLGATVTKNADGSLDVIYKGYHFKIDANGNLIEGSEGNIEFKEIAAGISHSIGLDTNGNIWTWGYNGSGQLGNETTTDSSVPVKIQEETKFKEIAAGSNHTMAIDEDGNLWTWGNNSKGQLGNGTTTNSSVPVKIQEGTKFIKVSGGFGNSVAIDEEGHLWTWGNNYYGELGNGTIQEDYNSTGNITPQIIKSDTKFIEVISGERHILAIDEGGNLWTWGDNADGQLGNGTTTDSNLPIKIQEETKFTTVAAGSSNSIAIDEEGNLWTWGDNNYGQLGNGTTTDSSIPIKIERQGKTKEIATKGFFTMILDEQGNLWTCGWNTEGELGNGTISEVGEENTVFTNVKQGTKFKKIAAGYQHSLAIGEDNKLYSSGDNDRGQLGNGNKMNNEWTNIGVALEKVATGGNHVVGIDKEGNLWTWGSNSSGQLGNGGISAVANRNFEPNKIMEGTKFKKVACGYYHSLAIDEEGNLWTWGSNSLGQLGNNSSKESDIPVKIQEGTKFKEIAAGRYHSVAIDEEGNLWTWGDNHHQQLGNGTSTTSKVPIKIQEGTKFQKVACGYEYSIAVDENGFLWTWGYNRNGLGDGNTTTSNIPIKIQADTKFKEIATGSTTFHNIAIDEEGNLWTWGRNNEGQLGNGTTTNSNILIRLNLDTKFVKVAKGATGGPGYSLAIEENGDLWGIGSLLSSNNIGKTSVPIKIKDDIKFKEMSSGASFNVGIDENGNVWTQGNNQYGELGRETWSTTFESIDT